MLRKDEYTGFEDIYGVDLYEGSIVGIRNFEPGKRELVCIVVFIDGEWVARNYYRDINVPLSKCAVKKEENNG